MAELTEIETITISGKTYRLCDRKARTQLEALAEKIANAENGENKSSLPIIFTMTGYQANSISYHFDKGGELEGEKFEEDKCIAKATFHFEPGEYSIMILGNESFYFDYNLFGEDYFDNSWLHLKDSKGENVIIGTGRYDSNNPKLFTITKEGDYTFEYEGHDGYSVKTDTFMLFKSQIFSAEISKVMGGLH